MNGKFRYWRVKACEQLLICGLYVCFLYLVNAALLSDGQEVYERLAG